MWKERLRTCPSLEHVEKTNKICKNVSEPTKMFHVEAMSISTDSTDFQVLLRFTARVCVCVCV
jgi:hypothetical protein